MRYLSYLFKCLMVLLLLLSSFSAGRYAVFAEEEQTTENEESLVDMASIREHDKNVMAIIGGDSSKRGNLIGAMQYNEQVHYIMTYTILRSQYMDTENYANLYKTGKGADGVSENIKDLTVKMGYDVILTPEVEAETPHDVQKIDETAMTKEAYEKATADFAKKITDKLSPLYAQKYVNLPARITDQSSVMGNVQIWGDWGIETPRVHVAVSRKTAATGLFFLKDYEFPALHNMTEYAESLKTESPANTIYGKLYDDVLALLYEGHYIDIFDPSIISATLANPYIEHYGMKHTRHIQVEVGADYYGAYFESGKGKELDVSELKKAVTYYPVRGLYESNHPLNITNEYSHFVTENGTIKKIKEELQADYENWQKLATAQKEIEKESTKLVQERGVAGLAWIPLDIGVDIKSQTYEKLIKYFDNGNLHQETGRVSAGGATDGATRAVQVNDFFAIKRGGEGSRKPSASPYFSYNYETHKNAEVASAFLGKSDAGLNTDLGLYAGIKTENLGMWDKTVGSIKGIFGQNDYGIAQPLTASEIIANNKQLYPHKYISYAATSSKDVEGLTTQSDYTMGIDNYGNIITGNTLQVFVPYWHNTAVFRDFNTTEKYFAATSLFQSDMDETTRKVLGAGASYGVPRENSDIQVETFTINKGNYNSFLDTVPTYAGSYITDLSGQIKNNTTNVQALALSIVTQTKESVKTWNETFVRTASSEGEVYISESDAGRGSDATLTDDELLAKFNAADLLERIQLILDYGMYEVMRLTIVGWVVSFYTGTISNFTMSEVFHTKLITETQAWQDMLVPLASLLGAFVGVYMLFLGFRVARNVLPLKSFFTQLIALTSILIIPFALYAPLVEWTLNKPGQALLGTQMEQASILDNYLFVEGKDREEIDDTYKMLFGSEAALRDRSQDYLVTLYTTTHKDGFDIRNATSSDIPNKNRTKVLSSIETGVWDKKDLISVRVSIYDMFEWVLDTSSNYTLFEWLPIHNGERYGNLIGYTEYSAIPEMTRSLGNVPYKSSDVYRMLYRHSATVSDSILGLYGISKAFRNSETDKSTAADAITDEERETLIRDLSLAREIRHGIYGYYGGVSPTTQALWAKYGEGTSIPQTDFFNLEETINTLIPERDYFSSRLYGDIYAINREVIDNYIVNYSVVRESIGSPSSFKRAEFHAVVLDMWFALNEKLDIKLAPTSFAASSVSFDNYMRLPFIPMSEYRDLNNKGLDNVGQFISLRAHPMTLLFFFLPMLFLLMIFGLVYLVTFYFFMMVLMTVSFIWNYVIKNNMRNKSWLGALIIIISFAIAKGGLMVIWAIMSYFLNYANTAGGSLYPYALIHSLVITVYLAIALYLLFTKVFKAVLQDKSNLGGEIFAESMGKFASSITGALKGEGMGFKGKGANSTRDSSVKKTLSKEGREGTIKPKKNAFSKNQLERLASADNLGRSRIAEDVADIHHAIHEDAAVGDGHEFGLRFAGVNDFLHKDIAYRLGETYDGISKGVVGLSQEQIDYLNGVDSVGQVVVSSHDGHNITTIDGITEEQTGLLRASLEDAGFAVVQDGTKLSFNSTGVNLLNAGVRKALFGDVLSQLLEETHKVSQLSEHTLMNTQEVDGFGVYHQLADGRVAFKVGADGLAPETLQKILSSSTYKEQFITEEVPMKKDGKYLQGQLIAIPKTRDYYQAAGFISNTLDTQLRAEHQVKARTEQEMSIIDILEEEKGEVYEYLADGMLVQQFDEGKYGIVYDASDSTQQQAAEQLKSVIYQSRDHEQGIAVDAMHRTMAYINDGGSNGYATATINTNENVNARQAAFASGLIKHNHTSKVYGGEQTDELQKAIQNVRNVLHADSNLLGDYSKAQHYLFSQGEEVLLGTNQDYERAIKSMLEFGQTSTNFTPSERGKQELRKMESTFTDLKRQLAKMDITEKEYQEKCEQHMASTQILLQKQGGYDIFVAEIIRDAAKKEKQVEKKLQLDSILNNYIKGKQNLKKQGVDVSVLSSYTQEEINTMSHTIANILDTKVNDDGTLTLNSRIKLGTEHITELTRMLLHMNEE